MSSKKDIPPGSLARRSFGIASTKFPWHGPNGICGPHSGPYGYGFPKVDGTPGRPRELPDEAYADRRHDSEPLRALLRWLGIEPHIAKRRTPHGSGLGKVRWVVERTISWLKELRRLRVCYDRLAVIIEA